MLVKNPTSENTGFPIQDEVGPANLKRDKVRFEIGWGGGDTFWIEDYGVVGGHVKGTGVNFQSRRQVNMGPINAK